MGWGSSDGWSNTGKKQSWGLWTCQCGNTQTGSQCKSCRKKWWEVQWSYPPKGPTPKKSPAANWTRPNRWRKPDQPTIGVQIGFLQHQIGGLLDALGTTDNPAFGALRASLQDALQQTKAHEPKKSKSARLTSVMSQLQDRHHKRTALKDRIAALTEELAKSEEGIKNLEEDIVRLGNERDQLLDEVKEASDDPECSTPPGEEADEFDPIQMTKRFDRIERFIREELAGRNQPRKRNRTDATPAAEDADMPHHTDTGSEANGEDD